MEIYSLVDAFENLLHQHTGMGYFVDLILKSLFVLLVMVGLKPFTRNLPASARHLVWCVGLVSLFVLPVFIGLLPKIHVPIETSDVVIRENSMTRGIASLAGNARLLAGTWWKALMGVYFSLLALQLCYILLGLVKVCALSREARPVKNTEQLEELETLLWQEGLTVPVRLLSSQHVYSPVSSGLFRPEIILPEGADTWSARKIRNVLLHELSHIRRLDWLTFLIVRITRAIYWYNPLVWYAAGKFEEKAEQACDDAVILNGYCLNEYANNLLEIARHARTSHLDGALVQAIAGSSLGSRILSILDPARRRQNTEIDWVVRGLIIGSLVIVVLASLRLVTLVNVTTLDPHASTAFSVIFIPKSEASVHSEFLADMIQEVQQDSSSRREERYRRYASAENAKGAAVMGAAQDAVEEGLQGRSHEKQKPSLLEEYFAYQGVDDARLGLENYINNYTSHVGQQVYDAIDLEGFVDGSPGREGQDAEQSLVPIRKISPEYPHRARARGIEGYSVVEYAIDHEGKVRDPVIVESSPGKVFNRSTLKAIEQYRFVPPTLDGEQITLEGRQTRFVYQLKPG
jgi:TonB family protein